MRVLGVESGIGSMLVSARNAGFEVVGNFETRKQFYSGTFEKNFPKSFLRNSWLDSDNLGEIDLLVSHPKCSSFSSLAWANPLGKKDTESSQSTFPLVVESIKKFKPRMFVIDNLPKSLISSPLTWWADQLKDYRLDLEFVSNYGYGNVQHKRYRVFIIGWKTNLDYMFIPGESIKHTQIKDILSDLDPDLPNHVYFPRDMPAPNMAPMTVDEASVFFQTYPSGKNPEYIRDEIGDIHYVKAEDAYKFRDVHLLKRIGTKKTKWDYPCQTITSSLNLYHPIRCDPFTCRERAIIQGFPNDFVFVFKNTRDSFTKVMGCQTGQAIPLQFTTFLFKQIHAFLNNEKYTASGYRTVSNEMVEQSKKEYCLKYDKLHCKSCAATYSCELSPFKE